MRRYDVIDLVPSPKPRNVSETPFADEAWSGALLDTCGRLARILSGSDSVRVEYENAKQVWYLGQGGAPIPPAYQQGQRIVLVREGIAQMLNENDDVETLATTVALLLHEYGHYEWTPNIRAGVWADELVKPSPAGQKANVRMLNALEDQRQELLTTCRYGKARDYLRYVVLKSMMHVAKKLGALPAENFLLYYGRRHFLPRPLLARMEAALARKYGDAKVDKAKALITEYLGLNSGTETNLRRMVEIARELAADFNAPQTPNGGDPCLERSWMTSRVSKEKQKEAHKVAAKILDKVDSAADANETEDDPAPEADGLDKTGDEDKPGDETGDDKSGDDTGDIEDLDSSAPGNGEELRDELTDYLKSAGGLLAGELAYRGEEIAARVYGLAAKKLARVFEEIVEDLRLKDHHGLRRGRLDVRRVPSAISQGTTRIFRRRQRSLEREATMAVQLMCDMSGSMYNHNKVGLALDATATIARALELSGHFSRVVGFSDVTNQVVLKDWDDRVMQKQHVGGGGTNPMPTLRDVPQQMAAILNREEIHNFALILLTDGQFNGSFGDGVSPEVVAAFADLRRRGAHVFLLGIKTDVGQYKDAVDGHIEVEDAGELEGKMRRLLKRLELDIVADVRRRML